MTIYFRCPHCSTPLLRDATGASCSAAHRFDRSADGYLHLLPSGRKRGAAEPGDSAEMIRARRTIFDAGYYRPIMDAVASVVEGRERVLDAGCGEGSYLAAINAPVRFGIDVSKPGVRLAARRHRDIEFAVASSYRLPFDDALFDAVISVFAPRPFEEFDRVLRTGGIVVTVSPGPDHLAGLRHHLYRDARPHEPSSDLAPSDTRPAIHTRRVQFDLSLTADDARLLLQMTPYWWSATPNQQANVGALNTTADMIIEVTQASSS